MTTLIALFKVFTFSFDEFILFSNIINYIYLLLLYVGKHYVPAMYSSHTEHNVL